MSFRTTLIFIRIQQNNILKVFIVFISKAEMLFKCNQEVFRCFQNILIFCNLEDDILQTYFLHIINDFH